MADKKSSGGPWAWLVGAIAAAAAAPHLLPASSANRTSAPPAALVGEPGLPATAPEFEQLVADYLGIDVTAPALFRRARALVDSLDDRRPPSADIRNYLRCFIDEEGDTSLERQSAHEAAAILGECGNAAPVTDAQWHVAFGALKPYVRSAQLRSPREERARVRLTDGTEVDASRMITSRTDERARTAARREMARAIIQAETRRVDKPVELQFIVATLPDPIDSYAGWQFDPMLESVQQAMSASGYLLDRFFVPTAARDARAKAGDEERHPSVVLFRRPTFDSPSNAITKRELLAMFLVPETPTRGVEMDTFRQAIAVVRQWTPDAARTLRILGPTFSGTSESLRRGLERFMMGAGSWQVRIVSGSATADKNQGVLQRGILPQGQPAADAAGLEKPADLTVTFHATVAPDSAIDAALKTYLNEELLRDRPEHRVAVLQESNTFYGMQSRQEGRNELYLPFPLHISRLRSDGPVPSQPDDIAPGMPRFRPLVLNEPTRALDQLPVFSGKTTLSYVELVLANIFETIRRERIQVVGITASDVRDKLFLARELATHCPNVVLYMADTDLFLIHPDYYQYTSGTIVAASYPIYSVNQAWTEPEDASAARVHFATGTVEGVYNATLALLNYDVDGQPLTRPDGKPAPRLVEYHRPGSACGITCVPPVWINVTGRDHFWPLKIDTTANATTYMFPMRPGNGEDASAATTERPDYIERHPPWAAKVAFAFFTLLAFGHATMLKGRFDIAPPLTLLRRPNSKQIAPRRRHASSLIYVSVSVVGLLFAYAMLALTLRGHYIAANAPGRALLALAPVVFFALVFAAFVATDGTYRATYIKELPKAFGLWVSRHYDDRKKAWPFYLWAAVVGVASVWALYNLDAGLRPHMSTPAGELADGPRRISLEMFVDRTLHLANGVSVLVPIFAFALSFFWWGVVETRRTLRPIVFGYDERQYIDGLTHNKVARARPLRLLHESIMRLPAWIVVALLLGAIGMMYLTADPVRYPIVSADGPDIGRFITTTIYVLEAGVAAALLQLVFVWRVTERLFQPMSAHRIADAYNRLPASLFPASIIPRMPTVSDLDPVVQAATKLSPAHSGLAEVFKKEATATPRLPALHSRTWRQLLIEATSEREELFKKWNEPSAMTVVPRTVPLVLVPLGAEVLTAESQLYAIADPAPSTTAAPEKTTAAAAEFVAMPAVFICRAIIARLWDNVLFVVVAIVALLVAHMSYPLQGRQLIEGLIWLNIAASVSILLYVFIRMERNDLLSRMRSTTPGQISWDASFLGRMAVYALVPLLGLFAAEFPEIGATVLKWLQPVQRALP